MLGKERKKFYKEIVPDLYYFSEGQMLDCNMYILKIHKKKDFCLIDAGNGLSLKGLLISLKELGLSLENLQKVLITHDHLDHIMGLYPLLEKCKTPLPEIYCHTYTAEMLKEGNENRIVPPLFGVSAAKFGLTISPLNNIVPLDEGDEFSFGNFTFNILYTPGHSKGSICFYEPTKKILFSGDVVFPQGSFGRYDFPGCSLDDLRKSIQRLVDLDVDILCAGHMLPVQNEVNRQIALSNTNINNSLW